MASDQSWEKCKYAFGGRRSDDMGADLEAHGLFGTYDCTNPQIVRLGIYEPQQVRQKDGASIDAVTLTSVMIGHELTHEDATKVKQKVDNLLRGCTHCRFFEQR